MGPGKQLPFQLLEAGRYEDALDAYRELKQSNPDDRSVSENRFNQMGYTYLGQGKLDLALSAFKINVELYPDSWNCYDSIGEAYMKNGDKDLAIRNFKRSVELNPNNQHGIQMLEQLEGGR
jgi:tetratricopeptide (TPR) repeat protein